MKKHKCATSHCRNKTTDRHCSTCRARESRKKFPVKYCYFNLKHNAKRRGVAFELTFEEFVQFCYATNYLKGKGKTSTSYSIDRIDNTKGYTLDNIQVLPLGENARKGNKTLQYDYATQYATVIHNRPITDYQNNSDYF